MGVEQGKKPLGLIREKRGIDSKTTEPQRFTIANITTALGFTITLNNMALVREWFHKAVKENTTIQFYRVKEEGRRGKPIISLVEKDFNNAVQTIRELRGRKKEEKRVEHGADGTRVNPPADGLISREPRIVWGDPGDPKEGGDHARTEARTQEAASRVRRQFKLNLIRTILSHLAASELSMLEKKVENLLVSCLPSEVSLASVTEGSSEKSPEAFFMALFTQGLEEFWKVQDVNRVTSTEIKIIESCLELRRKGHNVKSVVNIIGEHFFIPVPDEYKDEELTG